MAEAESSPAIGLVYVLVKVFSAIILGAVCRNSGLIAPEKGDTKALDIFVGRIAFPLLIFNTIATAQLGSIDFGVLLACNLAKLVVFWSVWLLGFLVFEKSQRRGYRGQRILTATIFGFLSVASSDFAIGFPVIEALYGDSMTVYIAANSLVGSFVMVPMTLVLLELGRTIRSSEESGATAEAAPSFQLGPLCKNLTRNPVIVMTVFGLLFQLLLGPWCLVDDEKGKGKQFAEPLNGVISYWTEPFGMLALFSTGLSLKSASVHFWPMVLVSFKLLVCAYLSYAFGLLFVTRRPMGHCLDLTFFYGSIPASSAPLVFASQFDESVVELVASAILVGYVMAGPNMFVSALFLSQESVDMTETLSAVQRATGLASSVGAGLVLMFLLLTRSSWGWSGALLGIYAGVMLCYGMIACHLTHSCSWLLVFCFNWCQKACFVLVLCLQISQSMKWQRPSLSWGWLLLLLVGAPTLLALLMPASALFQLCQVESRPLAGAICSSMLLLVSIGFAVWDLLSFRRGVEREFSGIGKHPVGVAKTACSVQALRLLMQVVNQATFAFNAEEEGGLFHGGFVQMMIIGYVLEVGQGIFCCLAVLLQEFNRDRAIVASDFICSITSGRRSGSEEPQLLSPLECMLQESFAPPPARPTPATTPSEGASLRGTPEEGAQSFELG